jgi:hypothetical protein
MPNVEEVKLHVAASVHQVEAATVGIRGVLDRIDESLARLRLTMVGSVHPSAVQAMMRLEQAKAKLVEAQSLAQGAIDSANEYRTTI